MANCHNLFSNFDTVIDLNDTRIKSLKKSRKKLRDRIRDDFKENHPDEIQPKFWSQGSFQMGTAVNPIGREKKIDNATVTLYKYDVDDGIYFIGDIQSRKSVTTYHNWIYDAVNGHTSQDPIDKNTCVRSIFSDGHHIDQPIYYEVTGQTPELAHKKSDWIESDPRAFTDWFGLKAKGNEQLKRLVRYFKAWADYQNFKDGSKKMPSGLVLTIWVSENAVFDDRDDVAMHATLNNIKKLTDAQSKLICLRPTAPENENLMADFKHTDFFKGRLADFNESASQAIAESNQKVACGKWQLHFGNRFSCALAKDEDENAKSYSAPAIVTSSAKSAN